MREIRPLLAVYNLNTPIKLYTLKISCYMQNKPPKKKKQINLHLIGKHPPPRLFYSTLPLHPKP